MTRKREVLRQLREFLPGKWVKGDFVRDEEGPVGKPTIKHFCIMGALGDILHNDAYFFSEEDPGGGKSFFTWEYNTDEDGGLVINTKVATDTDVELVYALADVVKRRGFRTMERITEDRSPSDLQAAISLIIGYNDHIERTEEDMISAIDQAIKLAADKKAGVPA